MSWSPPPGPPPPGPPPPGPPPPGPPPSDCASNAARFCGFVVSSMVFGALIMLYVQLVQVLVLHPSRGRKFRYIASYSLVLVPFALASFVGQSTYAYMMFVAHGQFPGGGTSYYQDQDPPWSDNLNDISGVIIPCLADLLIFYRVQVLWNRNWKILILLGMLYMLRLGISIPVFVWSMEPPNTWNTRTRFCRLALAIATFALNASFTGLVCYKLHSMRMKAERVLGRLQATLYNSYTTMLVESGVLFTIWTLGWLIITVVSRNSWFQQALSDPSKYINILTRLLIVLRIAQNRAWTADIIQASENGVLDWDVTSLQSVNTQNGPGGLQPEAV